MSLENEEVHMLFSVSDYNEEKELVVLSNLTENRIRTILEEAYFYTEVKLLKTIKDDDEDLDEYLEEEDFIFLERVATL